MPKQWWDWGNHTGIRHSKIKIFNIYRVRSNLIAKVIVKSSQKPEICKFKLDTGSDDNLMPITMYKSLFHKLTLIKQINKQENSVGCL